MRMNPGIILGIEPVNAMNALSQGALTANAINTERENNALAPFRRQQAELGVQQGQANLELTRERLTQIRQKAAQDAAAQVKAGQAEALAREAAEMERIVSLALAQPDQADQIFGSSELTREYVGMDPRAVGVSLLGVKDALDATEPEEPPEDPATFRALHMQAVAGGLEPGTPKYQQYMLQGGPEKKPLVDMSGSNFGTMQGGLDGVPSGQDPSTTATPRNPDKLSDELSKSDAAYLEAERNRARDAEELQGLAERLEVLGDEDRVGYTGFGGGLYHFADRALGDQLPGDVGAREAFKSESTNAVLTFTQKTKGAVSDSEMGLFMSAAPGLANTPGGNELISKIMKRGAERVRTRQQFMEAYARKKGSLEGAEAAWGGYMRENPILVEGDDGNLQVKPEGNWQSALDQKQAMDYTPQSIMQMDAAQLEELPVSQLTEQQLSALEARIDQLESGQ